MLAGYLASILIGFSLGLIGGGGSILTLPVLVYLFHLPPALATSYSLFIVGTTSLAGTISNYQQGHVHTKTALLFGATSVSTVFVVRRFLLPNIPDTLLAIGDWQLTHSLATMVLFAMLMLLASISMIRNRPVQKNTAQKQLPHYLLFMYGIAIGIVTGFLGAGGGFLIIPALVLLCKLDMKQAIGTSLLIITLNSLIGFTGDLGQHQIDWTFLFSVTAIAIVGLLVGGIISHKTDAAKLKRGFGWFVLVMGIYILLKEIL